MIIYLTHLTIYWTILFLSYHFFLKKETFFRYNRWYLLLGLVLGIIIPLVNWSAWFTHQPESLGQIYVAPIQYQVYQLDIYAASSLTTPWWQILLKWIYISGALVAGFKLVKGIQEIISLRRHATIKPKNGYNLILTEKLHIPFSFLDSIYWSRELYEESGVDQRIMAHEEQHVSSLHSLDILFIEILAVVFWFHPLVYLYRKELKEVHEYEADAAACVLGSKKEYGQLLLHQAQSGLQLALANHFFYSQLKNRFKMMTRKPSTRTALLKYLIALPVIGIAALIFSFSIHEKELNNHNSETIPVDTITPTPPDRPVPPPPPPPPPLPPQPPLPGIGEVLQTDDGSFTIKETHILYVNDEKIGRLSSELIDEYSQKGPWKFAYYSTNAAREKWGNHLDGKVYSLTSYDATEESIASHDPEVYRIVEKMPRFPGCDDMEGSETEKKQCADNKMLDYLYSNLRYPEAAAREGIEGVVVASFIVEKDGSLSDIKAVRSPDNSLEKEAIRMIRLMNDSGKKWTPGEQNGQKMRDEFLLPIKFQLNEKQSKSDNAPNEEEAEKEDKKQNNKAIFLTPSDSEGTDKPKFLIDGMATKSSKKPIIVIDGVVHDKDQGDQRLKDIDPKIIQSIHVLKNQQATDKYGEAAKHGAIEIYIKEDPDSLAPESGKKSVAIRRKNTSTISDDPKTSNPIILLDGEMIGHGEDQIINSIPPSSIESIGILKGEAATEKYGNQGRHGVIEITSKVPQEILDKNDLTLTELNIYPNPVLHQLNVQFAGPEGEYQLEIMDISGVSQKVKTLSHSNVTKTEMDMSDLNAGMYYLIITSGNKVTTKSFVKQ